MIGGDSNGVPFHKFCWQEWRDRYGNDPPWLRKDYILLATALKAFGGEDYARAAWKSYLMDQAPFYAGHSPGKFVADMGRWAIKLPKPHEIPKELASRARIMREVYTDPEWADKPEVEKRNEYARRARELP